MSEASWMRFLTPLDREVYAASGYGARGGFGRRPALVVIDVNYAFCGDHPEPVLQSIKRWRNSCGDVAWECLGPIKSLLAAARAKGIPVIYTTGVRRPDQWDSGSWSWKNSRTMEQPRAESNNAQGYDILAEIAPQASDIVVLKQKPSAFAGTPFHSYLTLLGCDSILVAGTTTSGCVRATVVDAFSNNIRVAVAEDACFDRFEASHAISLCDMHAKYADVLGSEEIIAYVRGLPDGLFQLPRGNGA